MRIWIMLAMTGIILHASQFAAGQNAALVNMSASPHAVLHPVDMGAVKWTRGFWAERFRICRDSMVPHLWAVYTDPKISHAFANFMIAAGLDTGTHSGPPFHDGDFYKLLEAEAALYAITKDKRLDSLMDTAISVIARSQREDGYIHTPVVIEERNHPERAAAKGEPGQSGAGRGEDAFGDRLHFEAYNMGHLMTAACVHYRATGKTSLLQVAIKAARFLETYYRKASPELARNAICPSHYMGLIELYRTTHDTALLGLARSLIDLRGWSNDGTDDNQDRVPFRRQTTAMGHAVRANYLYAGVADDYAETGDDSLFYCLDKIWQDVVYRKMYITGGCGALYDGVSPQSSSYDPAAIQEVHQAYGREYQLPNATAHNETCANIGSMLWNWRMLLVTGEAKFADVLEKALYNSVLSGGSLDGLSYFYTNPLRASRDFPYSLRWSGGRAPYISLSNCCPPNLARTIAEVADYVYCINEKGLWLNLYGGNSLSTRLGNGKALWMDEETEYPWDGNVRIVLRKAPAEPFSIFMRIPGWCTGASLLVNGRPEGGKLESGTYVRINRHWAEGDTIHLTLPMPVRLMESDPLVEETRNQVTVQRGPVVYCLESPDLLPASLPKGKSLFDIALPATVRLRPKTVRIGNSQMVGLEGTAKLEAGKGWGDRADAKGDAGGVSEMGGRRMLYRPLDTSPSTDIPITLIPYFAWANRGASDMTVWMPVIR